MINFKLENIWHCRHNAQHLTLEKVFKGKFFVRRIARGFFGAFCKKVKDRSESSETLEGAKIQTNHSSQLNIFTGSIAV